jgi:hypothetical protein
VGHLLAKRAVIGEVDVTGKKALPEENNQDKKEQQGSAPKPVGPGFHVSNGGLHATENTKVGLPNPWCQDTGFSEMFEMSRLLLNRLISFPINESWQALQLQGLITEQLK